MAGRLKRAAVLNDLRTRAVGRNFIYRVRTTSTMDDARAAAEEGAPAGTVVFAEEQTAGRGRFTGRRWVSPAGQNLYFTIVVRPTVAEAQRLSMLTPVAVANAVEQVVGLYPRIKWPNDLHLRGRKFAGILIEGEWQDERPQFALVGIGVNVNTAPGLEETGVDRPAISLAETRGRPVPREPLLAAILTAFERALKGAALPALYDGWLSRLETLGRQITLSAHDGSSVDGIAESAREDGALLVRLTTGELRAFHSGEVSLRPGTEAPAGE